MRMPDVNILVYAHRADERLHRPYAQWLTHLAAGPEPFALSVLVVVGFLRVATNPRVYPDPTPLSIALAFVEELTAQSGCVVVGPGPEHLANVARLARATGVTGAGLADAAHAAVAIEAGATWVTRDADFARFAPHGLRWQHLVLEPPADDAHHPEANPPANASPRSNA